MKHLETTGPAAKQSQRPADVAARQHEAVRALLERIEELAEHAPQTGEALEGAQLRQAVDQERGGRVLAAGRPAEEAEEGIESLARAAAAVTEEAGLAAGGVGRVGGDDGEEPLGRGRCALDIDVLAATARREVQRDAALATTCGRLPQPPSTTGMRAGAASSAATTRFSIGERSGSTRAPDSGPWTDRRSSKTLGTGGARCQSPETAGRWREASFRRVGAARRPAALLLL